MTLPGLVAWSKPGFRLTEYGWRMKPSLIHRVRRALAGSLGLLLVLSSALQANPQDVSGSLGEAGFYRFVVPESWLAGDSLIIWNHGFSLAPVAAEPSRSVAPDEETRQYWLERGYAIAAGSYSTRGWAMFDLARDQRALLTQFRDQIGEPGEILLVGGSLGGLVSLKTAGSLVADDEPLAGVYALCPPLAGARSWDRAFEFKLAYDAVCDGVGGGEFDRGAEPLSWLIDYDDIPDDLGDFRSPDSAQAVLRFAARVDQCTGVLRPEVLRSPGQRQRLETLMTAFELTSEDFFLTNVGYAVFALADLVRAPEKLHDRNPFDSRPTSRYPYGYSVESVALDPMARFDLRRASNPRGPWGDARVLVTHTSRDELVIPEHLSELPKLGLAENRLASALVREDAVGHCAYSRAEFLAGFDGLRRWIDGEAAPDAAQLNTLCEQSNTSGDSDNGRCAYEPSDSLAPYDAKVRLPDVVDELSDTLGLSGVWWDPARSGEGLLVEMISNELAVVSWFTYPPSGSNDGGEQRWLGGLGRIRENGVEVDDVREYRGGRFGQAFDPAEVESLPWGRIELALGRCGEMGLRYAGPQGWGDGEQRLQIFSDVGMGLARCLNVQPSPLPPRSPFARYSGSWYRGPGQGGEGVFLQSQDGGPLVAVWYTYDANGTPVHLTGPGREDGDMLVFDLTITAGAHFGVDFNSADVVRTVWGQIRLEFANCDQALMQYTGILPGWGAGEIALQRLTSLPDLPPCQ